MSLRKLPLVLAACALAPLRASAQAPAIPVVGVGFGVDTTAADVGDIVRLLRAYLAGPGVAGDSAAEAAGLWTRAGVAGRAGEDLTGRFAYQGFPATVLAVTSAARGDSVYMVRTLYARGDSAGGPVRPIALQRLYAVRAPGAPYGWKLSSALPRVTAAWQTLSTGRITFRYAPGLRPDSARAQRAEAFVDSVATLLGVPAPGHVEYLVTHAPDEYMRALGLDFFVWASGRGSSMGGAGFDGMVLAGDPAAGEAYYHELTHAIVQRYVANGLVGEGLATWLGGSRGRSPGEMYGLLVAYQRAWPAVTLKALLDQQAPGGDAAVSDAGYATSALVVDAIYRRSGVEGVRALSRTGPGTDALMAVLRARLPEAKANVDTWWRRTAEAFAAGRER